MRSCDGHGAPILAFLFAVLYGHCTSDLNEWAAYKRAAGLNCPVERVKAPFHIRNHGFQHRNLSCHDLGTTALKCIITDHKQRVAGLAEVALAISRPRPGWAEQNPQDWWLALRKACKMLSARNAKDWSRIGAIGLAGQMHGAVILDGVGQVLHPAILWNDGRAGAEAGASGDVFRCGLTPGWRRCGLHRPQVLGSGAMNRIFNHCHGSGPKFLRFRRSEVHHRPLRCFGHVAS